MVQNIFARDAFLIINLLSDVKLVDVRTSSEWDMGVPDIADNKILFCDWNSGSDEFFKDLIEKIPSKETTIFFLCRSGVRSKYAAKSVISLGYKNCYNITDGFLGTHHDNGWINSNLAWHKRQN